MLAVLVVFCMSSFRALILLFLCLSAVSCQDSLDRKPDTYGASLIDYAGYKNCIQLRNLETSVVLGPHCGGRVLAYSHKGRNIILLKGEQNGWAYSGDGATIEPSGGRFDIGPERTLPQHLTLWIGEWDARISGQLSAEMISQVDTATGLRVTRSFKLDKASSRLLCTQKIENTSKEEIDVCHWGRTFVAPGGVCIIPKSTKSRFPQHFIAHEPGAKVSFWSKDPQIEIQEEFILVNGPTRRPELGFDSQVGWIGYQTPDDYLFIKSFPVYPERRYNMMIPITFCVYYGKTFCELEPIGPAELLGPRESASFTETWWLLPHKSISSKATSETVVKVLQRSGHN